MFSFGVFLSLHIAYSQTIDAFGTLKKMSNCLRYCMHYYELLLRLVVKAVSCFLESRQSYAILSCFRTNEPVLEMTFSLCCLTSLVIYVHGPTGVAEISFVQKRIHRVAYPGVTWLVSVQACWKLIWSIIFLSISDGAKAYSRHVLSRWNK